MNKWLSFYHPSTVVFVDDQQGFLTAMKYRLPSNLSATFFNNPLTALFDIKNFKSSQQEKIQRVFTIDNQFQELENQNMQDAFIGLRLDQICEISRDSNRFSEQSVVVVDYSMPELDGINFCRKLKEYPIKKIMLTANSDHSMATQAFNEGLIDYFLVKDSPNLMDQLSCAIFHMQKSYFHSLMDNRFANILDKIVPFFNDSIVIAFYEKLMKELRAVEFYLLDRYGSVLYITYEGVPITLVISPEEVIESYSNIAKDQDEKEIADLLSKREKLIYFPNQIDLMRPVIDWDLFLFDAIKFPGKSGFFYTIVYDQNFQCVSEKQIESHKAYKKNQ